MEANTVKLPFVGERVLKVFSDEKNIRRFMTIRVILKALQKYAFNSKSIGQEYKIMDAETDKK